MLRRKPTRIVLKTEDKQEYEELKKAQNESQSESRSARIGLSDRTERQQREERGAGAGNLSLS